MTRYFLSLIKIEGFRGINNEAEPLELRFRTDAVNSVFAINATGKSSIFEALSYAIRGTIAKLDELQVHEKPGDYYCNRFHSKSVATIELEFLSDDGTPNISIVVQRDNKGNRNVSSPSGHLNPEAFLQSLNEDFTLLDYRTFSRFIDSSPLERGRSFSALLGLSIYSDLRQALQSVSDARVLNSDLDVTSFRAEAMGAEEAAQAACRRAKASYEGLTGKLLPDLSRLDDCASEVLSTLSRIELVKASIDGKTLTEIDFTAIKDLIRSAERGDERKDLEKAIESLSELEGLGLADTVAIAAEQVELLRLLQERDDLLTETRGDLFKRLYEAARAVLDAGGWLEPNRCLVCEIEGTTAISDLVQDQLAQFSRVTAKSAEIKLFWQSSAWSRRLQALETAKAFALEDEKKVSSLILHKTVSELLSIENVDEAIKSLEDLEGKRAAEISSASDRKKKLERELPTSLVTLTEQVEHGRQFRDAFDDHQRNVLTENAAHAKIRVRERWQQFIEKAAESFAAAEADLSRRKIAAIDTEYKAMFAQIMAIDEVVPDLERSAAGEDLKVQLSNFYGQSGLSARALLSESYRNALAISVFLAAALKQTGAPRFVVLDDVTSSFDSGHQWRLMEVIRCTLQYPKSLAGLQFIILSHDGFLEKYFDKIGNTVDWHHQRLQGWPPLGAVMSQAQDASRLRTTAVDLLDAGQVKEAEPLIRQYLEFKLMTIIMKVRIRVPLDFAVKDHMKTVGNCLGAINNEIDLHKKAGILVLDASQVNDLATVHVPALVGNWISHYETAVASSIAPLVLKGVLKTIDDFAECFRFDDKSSGSLQRRWYRSLSARM